VHASLWNIDLKSAVAPRNAFCGFEDRQAAKLAMNEKQGAEV
jgi:hypothetical protein